MQINRTLSAAPAGSAAASSATSDSPVKREDFLKLLVTQLSHQDPLKPTADTDFLAQLAQFSALEEMRNLNTSFQSFASGQEIGQMAALIGKKAEVQVQGSESWQGTVQAIKRRDGNILLMIDGQEYKPQDVIRIF